MSVQNAVSEFCRGISEHTDDAVVQYLTGIVEDACEEGNADIADVEEMVHGFLPDIAKLSQEERHDRLWSLLTQVHAIHQNGSPTEDLCHAVLAPARAPEAQPSPNSQTAQQKSSNSSNQEPDSKSREQSHSEEHEQAINTLSALWPSDVPMDRAFLESLLGIQCRGNLEAAGTRLLECPDVARQQMLWQRATQEERKRRIAAAQKEKEARKNVISKFSLEAQNKSTGQPRSKGRGDQAVAPWSANQPVSKKGVRYRDGFAVASKGEKHIEVPLKEDWNGGSAGKVYTKGKRGKGFA